MNKVRLLLANTSTGDARLYSTHAPRNSHSMAHVPPSFQPRPFPFKSTDPAQNVAPDQGHSTPEDPIWDRAEGLEEPIWDHLTGHQPCTACTSRLQNPPPCEDRAKCRAKWTDELSGRFGTPPFAMTGCAFEGQFAVPHVVQNCCIEWTLDTERAPFSSVTRHRMLNEAVSSHGNKRTTSPCTCKSRTQRENGDTLNMMVGGFCRFVRSQCFQLTLCYLSLLLALALTVSMCCILSFSAVNPTTRNVHSISWVPKISYRHTSMQGKHSVQSRRGVVRCCLSFKPATKKMSFLAEVM